MSFFGGGVDKATKRYNAAKRDYQEWRIQQNQQLLNEARPLADLGAESDLAYDTISGSFLNANSNPYIRGVAEQGAQQVQDAYNKGYIPSMLSQYAGSGRYGSGMFQKSAADMQSQMNQDIANATNQLYYQNYSNERALQEQARARAAQQYDPLNRYGQYQSMLNSYNPGEPASTLNRGTFLGSVVQGSLAGGSSGSPWGAIGGGVGGGLSYWGSGS